MFKRRRVVITGIGMITPIGNTIESNWHNLINGNSGINLINTFNTTQYKTKIAGLIKNFNYKNNFSNGKKEHIDLFIQYGLIACQEAINNAGLIFNKYNNSRFGIAIGSGLGGLNLIEKNTKILYKKGPKKITPFLMTSTLMNMLPGNIAINYKLTGPSLAISTSCSSGINNIGIAFKIISYNDADIMITGASEKAVTPLSLSGFCSMNALSKRNHEPQKASRPWDKDRDGFVLGDGAGILILEEYTHAKKRNANIFAELIGFGMSNDAYHITSPPINGKGAQLAMFNALKDANLNPENIKYINAHGTSTKIGDIAEVNAIKKIFKNNYYKLFVSSTKSITGHLLGAAGAIESIYSILSLKNQIIPPTINLDNPDKNLDLDFVPKISRDVHNMKYVLCNSFGFGGSNASLIFKKI
ncbi:beta-ketoacyl-ACP synthase II [Enterobacteriaceae endosymbiont of Donacia bicoloricornis]|uniref:beta-ketoacyl-ACP synthase II n=1 Tax=Enterobacteriaceae endosymbiont of Donacia bicoloricornis TaxID=2675772 RepID=UPI001449B25F|nr:beta-ketoacyl-ACP synthase II [Enterobacteriaceae endosymbiont of Donacia bicoloricornis]QJC37624.1 beta-ketoacyl-ACP synthase II [Enterobacteriaceae endosymbiont of Donacia bicoloricornis]